MMASVSVHFSTNGRRPSVRSRCASSASPQQSFEELQGAAHWAEICEIFVTNTRVQLELDSATSVCAIEIDFSAKPAVLACLSKLRASLARSGVHFRVRHVLGSTYNKIADALSRDDWSGACREAESEHGLPLLRM